MLDFTQMAAEICNYLRSEHTGEDPITPRTDLLDAGLLDSLMMVDLLAFIESQFGVRFDDSEIAPRHFRTVDCLVRLVAHKLLGPLQADCLLCREVDAFKTIEDLDATYVTG